MQPSAVPHTPADLSRQAVLERARKCIREHGKTRPWVAICAAYLSLCTRHMDIGSGHRQAFGYYAPDVLTIVRIALLQYVMQDEKAGHVVPETVLVNELLEAWRVEPATSDVFAHFHDKDPTVFAVTETGFVLSWMPRNFDTILIQQPPAPEAPKARPGQHNPRRTLARLTFALWPPVSPDGRIAHANASYTLGEIQKIMTEAGYGPEPATAQFAAIIPVNVIAEPAEPPSNAPTPQAEDGP